MQHTHQPQHLYACCLAQAASAKVQTYVLALLLMLCMAEARHAAVVVRTGALPALVTIIREGTNSGNREFAAAVVASIARSYDNQLDIVSAGGVLACIRWAGLPSPLLVTAVVPMPHC